MHGFMTNESAVTGITNAWNAGKGVKLEATATGDDLSSQMPQSCYVSHLVVKADETVAACTQLQATLTWDAAGDDLMMGPTQMTDVWTGLNDVSLRCASFKADAWVRAPSDQDNIGEVYLWLQTDAGTVNVPVGCAQLFWATRSGRPGG